MREFPKPVVVVSKCLGFAACRWDGVTIPDEFVESLKPFVEFRPVCPEVEIGLGVPRDPVKVVEGDGEQRLLQPATGRDVTREMESFASDYLEHCGDVDGFILKSRSPSCGWHDVEVYPRMEECAATNSKGRGFFGIEVALAFDYKAVEDEARLGDFRIREDFLTKLFAISDFRSVYDSGSIKELIDYHARNKYLLMMLSQEQLRVLGQIVADHKGGLATEVIQQYADEIVTTFTIEPRPETRIDAIMHAFGHFSKELGSDEKASFLDSVEKYRASGVPFSVPVSILRSFVIRFDEEYLKQQTFLQPFPDELVTVTDSGKGRERKV